MMTNPYTPYEIKELDCDKKTIKGIEKCELENINIPNSINCERHYIDNNGIKIPMTIVRDKSNNKPYINIIFSSPILSQVYGCYGLPLSIKYNPLYLYLLLKGWSIAFCHVRGGGDYGSEWYNDGKGLNKMNSIKDYIKCNEYLSKLNFIDKNNIIGYGESAGGIIIGSTINFTDILKGAVLLSPFLNIKDTLSDPNFPLSSHEKDEWGDINNKKISNYIMKYDPFYNIKEKKYPNIFIIAGSNDYRCSFNHTLQYVMKIKQNNKTNTDILLKEVYNLLYN